MLNSNMKDKEYMDYVAGIKQAEIDFPKLFASFEEREYGILFIMKDNKDSYDGNHACIYPEKIKDFGAVLDDIEQFYQRLDRGVSVWHPFKKDYFKDNIKILEAHGYTYTAEEDHRVMLLTAENAIITPKRLDIRVLTDWDEHVAADILIPSGEPWEIEVTKKRLGREGTYLFVGYLDGEAVAYTDIHKSVHGNTMKVWFSAFEFCIWLLILVVKICTENGRRDKYTEASEVIRNE